MSIITEVINRRLFHRLILRELRALFQQYQRRPVENRVPQNIWDGNYFRELDEHIEADNARIRELVPRLPLYELELGGRRNVEALYTVFDEMELHISLVKKVIFIHKSYGLFEINISSTNVNFIPSICLHCNVDNSCRKRPLCIVQDHSSNPGTVGIINYNSPMENLEFHSKDLLLLSKAIAIEYNLLPDHVINQMQSKFYCSKDDPFIKDMMRWLRIFMLREFDQLSKFGSDLPPISTLTARAQLQRELRALFQRRHQNNQLEGENNRDENPPPPVRLTARAQLQRELRALFRRRDENQDRRAESQGDQRRNENARPLGSPSVRAELMQELRNVFQGCQRINVPNNNETARENYRKPIVQYGITARGEIIFELRDLLRRARCRNTTEGE